MAKRRKMAPVEAPKTLPEAIDLLKQYVAIEGQIEQLENDTRTAIANIKGEADAVKKPLEQKLADFVARLRNWWAVAGDALTDGGKTRSTELAGCKIGMRLTTARVVCKGAQSDAKMLERLEADSLLDPFIRRTPSPDKESIHRMFVAGAVAIATEESERTAEQLLAIKLVGRLEAAGFSLKQDDEFFVDRPKAPAVEKIVEPQQEAA